MLTILLAAYNGAKYLPFQLDSIFSQTVQDFKLYICDDGSTDGTLSIIRDYECQYPDKINVVRNNQNSGGAKHNFLRMMLEIRDDYLMLCDQDDIWMPDKIEKLLAKMREMETGSKTNAPILIYTDLQVVDNNLSIISPSFEKFMDADFTRFRLQDLLVQNVVTGCTAIYNRALAEFFTAIPAYTVMHDWWLALVASCFATVAYLPEQTVLYRQHGDNEIGAKDVRSLRYKLDRLFNYLQIKTSITQTYSQAGSLLDIYSEKLKPQHLLLLQEYCSIPKLGKRNRIRMVLKLRTLKHGLSRNIAHLLFL